MFPKNYNRSLSIQLTYIYYPAILLAVIYLSSPVQLAFAADNKPQIKHIYFPVDQPGQLPAGDWKPILYGEILAALEAEGKTQPAFTFISSLEMKLSRSSKDQLTGNLKLQVTNLSADYKPLNCKTSNIIIKELVWGNEQITFGNNSAGEMIILVPPGKSLLAGKVLLPYKHSQNLDEINLTLPPSINAKILVETEASEVLYSNLGLVKLLPEAMNRKLLWSVSAGARQDLQFRISTPSPNAVTQTKSVTLLDELQTWNVTGSQTNLIVDIKPDIVGVGVNNLTFIVPEKLVIQTVSLLSGSPLNYRVEPEGSDKKLIIELPEAVRGAYLPIRLRFVLHTVLDKKWSLPQLQPVTGTITNRNVVLQVKSPLSLKQLQHPGYEQKGYTTENNVQDQFQFQWLHSDASLEVELTYPAMLPTSSTVYQFNAISEAQKIQGYTLLSYKNVADPKIVFKVPVDYTLYDLKVRSLTEKNNQAIGWRLQTKSPEYDIYELQLLNPPDADSRLVFEWLVSVPYTNNSSSNSKPLLLPGMLGTDVAANYILYQSPTATSKIYDNRNLPLVDTTLPFELWPPEFNKLVLPAKTDKVFALPEAMADIISIKVLDKNIVQQFMEQGLSLTDHVQHQYQIPLDAFPNRGQFQVQVLGFDHNLDWQLQLKNGDTVRIYPEKEVQADRSICTFSLNDDPAMDATNLLLEIEHPLMGQVSTIQIIPIHLKQPLPVRFTLKSDIELKYEVDGPLKLLASDLTNSNASGTIFELADASVPWSMTFDLEQTPQLVRAPLAELVIKSILYHESTPKLEHNLYYKNLPATQLADLLGKLPPEYKLCAVFLNQVQMENPDSLLQKISRYRENEIFQQCQLVVQENIHCTLVSDWQISLEHFVVPTLNWNISLSLPLSMAVEKITGLRSSFEVAKISSVSFSRLKEVSAPYFPVLKNHAYARHDSLPRLFDELNDPSHLQTYQIYYLSGNGATFPSIIKVDQKSYSSSLTGLVFSILSLASIGVIVKLRNRTWGIKLLFLYLFLACFLWWMEASMLGIVLFTAGVCGFLFPHTAQKTNHSNSTEEHPVLVPDESANLKKHSTLIPANVLMWLVLSPLIFSTLTAQEPVTTTGKTLSPTLADLLKLPVWDVVIPFSGNASTPPVSGEIVYIEADLHQALRSHSKLLPQENLQLFNNVIYSCELEQDGSLRIATDLIVAAPAGETELKIPFKTREITIAGIHGCLIENQTASISSNSDSSLILKIPPDILVNKLEESKSESVPVDINQGTQDKSENRWVNYKVHLDFYPKPISKTTGNFNYHVSIPSINNSLVETNFKSRIYSGLIKSAYEEHSLSNKSPDSLVLGNISALDIQIQQQPVAREFFDLELHLITLWEATPIIPKAQVFLEISGIEQNLAEFSLPLPADIRFKNIYGNELQSYQLFSGENPAVSIKLKDGTKGTSYILLECEYLNPGLTNSLSGVLVLPAFRLPELKPRQEQTLSATSRQIGINPANGFRLQEILPEQAGYSPIARDMLYRASPLEFPLSSIKETDITRSRWETFISKPPSQLYRITKDEPFSVELVRLPQSIKAGLAQQMVINKEHMEYKAVVNLPARATPYYHLELTLDGEIKIDAASLKQQNISRALKWSQAKNNLSLFFEDLPGEIVSIQLSGKQSLPVVSNQAHPKNITLKPALGSPRLVLDANDLSITNNAPDSWSALVEPIPKIPAVSADLQGVVNLMTQPANIVLKPQVMTSTVATAVNQSLVKTYSHVPILNESTCQWTHILQALHSDRVSGVSACKLESGLNVVNLDVNEKYQITTIALNGKPLSTYSQRGSQLKLTAVDPQELIHNMEISWELNVVPHKYFEWPEIVVTSKQLLTKDERWIWFKQALADLKPNRKLQLQNQTKRSTWITDLEAESQGASLSHSLTLIDQAELISQSEQQQLIFFTTSEMKYCLWVNNLQITSSKNNWWYSYIFLLPCLIAIAIFVVERVGVNFNVKHIIVLSLATLLIFPCFYAYPAHTLISLLLMAFSLLYRFIVLGTNLTSFSKRNMPLKIRGYS
jgi:hypothetical protein